MVLQCVILVSGRPLSVHYANVSMMWRMVYLNLCPFPRKGPLTHGTEFMSFMLMLLIKPLSYFLFTVRKFPRFWKVPTLGAWIWHHFSLWAKSWFLSPSSPMSSLTTGSQPAKCLWWWRCSRLWGFRAPSISPWPSRRCQRPLSASTESRFDEKQFFFSCRWTLWTTPYLVSLCASLVTFISHCQSWQSFQNVIHTPLSSYIECITNIIRSLLVYGWQ